MHICGYRTKNGELLILASHGISGREVADMYLRRWNIETGFSQMKSNGLCLEDTRLSGHGKMDVLFGILAIAMAWCYSCGKMSESVIPIKLASHGRKEESIFGRGLDVLRSCFPGIVCIWSSLFGKMVSILKNALSFVGSVLPAMRLKSVTSRRWI